MAGGPIGKPPEPEGRDLARPNDPDSTTRLKQQQAAAQPSRSVVASAATALVSPPPTSNSDLFPTLTRAYIGLTPPTFADGDTVAGRYRVVRFLAEGGMGEVYEVEDLELHEHVALKTIRPAAMRGGELVERFKREIQLARQVTHPNVCRIFEFGIHRGIDGATPEVLFLTMELLGGETLAQRIHRQGRLSTAEAAPIVNQVAAALATAHEAGIVHRDFKSSNVMLVPGKSGERAVVTDFGLARSMGQSSQAVTISGEVLGTPAYMAPEQLSGGPIGPPTDIYALGIVLYEMVTGQLPFSGDSPFAIALMRLQSLPTAPRKVNPELEALWETVILRCLERDPAERYATADAVARALSGEAAPVSPRARRRLTRTVGIAAALALFGVGAWWGLQRWSASSTAAGSPGAVAEQRKSIAVLGFANLSGRPENAWLSTAFAEMLRSDLGAGGQLRTIPGESVSRMKVELGLVDSATLAGDTLAKVKGILGSEFVVLGSYVANAGGSLVLNYALQDAGSGEVVDTDSIPGGLEDIFAVVSRAGDRMRNRLGAAAIQKEAADQVRLILPADPEAARLYAEGLERLRAFDAVGAKELLTQAVVAAPDHALIHAAHGEAWGALGYDNTARKELRRATELAGQLPREERLAIEARLYELEGKWDQALLNRQALARFNPDDLEHGLRLATTQVASRPAAALETLAGLRRLPPPAGQDPRIELVAATAAKAATDWSAMESAAATAAIGGRARGANLLTAQALLAQCDARVKLGRFEDATPLCDEAREIFTAARDGGSVAQVENVLGVAQAMQDEGAAALAAFERALAAFRAAGDRRNTQKQLNNIGNIYADEKDLAAAEERYTEALALARETGDHDGEARTLNNLGSVRWEATPRRPREALEFYTQALTIYRDLGAAANVASTLYNIAEARQELGELDPARAAWTEAVEISRQSGQQADLADSLLGLAGCEVARGEWAAAAAAAQEARQLYGALEDPELMQQAGEVEVTSLERLGRADDAARVRAEMSAVASAPT